MLLALDRVEHGADQPRLADPGLADQQHRLALDAPRLPPALQQERQLLVAADHGRRAARPAGLEAAVGGALARDPERRHVVDEALEAGRAERAQPEHLAEQPAGAVRDHHGAGLGRLLQPGGQVRRLADHHLLPGGALADQVADDHEPGRDPDPRRERLPGRGGEPGDGLRDRQAGPHGALGVVLVRPGPAEVGQHAVAHQLGHVPVDARDLTRDRVLVRPQDLAHVLRIEAARERGRADEVDEHHRELPALGPGGRRRHRARRGTGINVAGRRRPAVGAQGVDGVEQPAPVADDGDARCP